MKREKMKFIESLGKANRSIANRVDISGYLESKHMKVAHEIVLSSFNELSSFSSASIRYAKEREGE